jgi:DNA modification methylase
LNTFRILEGDARKLLAGLEPESVQTCVTSPPYWGLRDYKVDGQLGLEPTPESYIEAMGDIFDEVKRVLRPDGTIWVNMGDSYASQGKNRTEAQATAKSGLGGGLKTQTQTQISKITGGLKAKDLVGMPWMLAFELRRRGWFLRQDIIWSKPNPMPESVTDRCTKAHEYLFMLSKSPRYFFDQDAIKEPAVDTEGRGGAQHSEGRGPTDPRGSGGPTDQAGISGTWEDRQAGGARTAPRGIQRALEIEGGGQRAFRLDGTPHEDKADTAASTETGARRRPSVKRGGFDGKTNALPGREAFRAVTDFRNKRDVWTIATKPFPEAHFATYPPELVEPCILAGSRPGDLVLDPFNGAGTTGLVALRHGRRYLGIELNPEYAEMARRRILADQPLLNQEEP